MNNSSWRDRHDGAYFVLHFWMVAVGKVGSVKTAEQMKAEYREVISLLRKGHSIRDVAKVKWKGREYGATSEAIKNTQS